MRPGRASGMSLAAGAAKRHRHGSTARTISIGTARSWRRSARRSRACSRARAEDRGPGGRNADPNRIRLALGPGGSHGIPGKLAGCESSSVSQDGGGRGDRAAVAGGIPAIVAAQKPPSFPKGTTLNILEWVSFVPASDVEFKRLAAEFGKLAGVEITVDQINMNDLNPRIASAIETRSGPDIIMMISNWPHLYADGLADVDDVAEEIAKRDGAFYEFNRRASVVDDRWKAVPLCSVNSTWNYLEDWFKEAGAAKFPDTWDELRRVGTELKKKGHPIGQAFGHSLGDPNQWAYPVTWCFGGAEIDDKGKAVINSKQTIEALRFTVAFWKDCLDQDGLAWDDTSNNRAFLAGTISATINVASIYFVAKRQFPEIAKAMNHAHMPRGPAGRFYSIGGERRGGVKNSQKHQGGQRVPPRVF